MPRTRIPSYRLHKSTGLAVVTLLGRDYYLGRHGTDESRQRYDRLIARYLQTRSTPAPARRSGVEDLSVAQVLLAFLRHATERYRKGNRATSQLDRVKRAVRCARGHLLADGQTVGELPAGDFGPLTLKRVRQGMVEQGWCRTFINSLVGVLKTALTWAASEELIPGEVAYRLRTVRGLQRGELGVRESAAVRAVPWAAVKQTLAQLLPVTRDLVLLQRWTGMRPCEVVGIRPADVNTEGLDPEGNRYEGVWVYTVADAFNKNAHKGVPRIVFIGPRGQAVLRKYLTGRDPSAYCFSPAEARKLWEAEKRRRRKSKVQPSQTCRRKARPRKRAGERYSTDSYNGAVDRAAKAAGAPHWHVNQLRHLRGTELRSRFGADVARTVLGHQLPGVTGVYAEPDLKAAAEAVRRSG